MSPAFLTRKAHSDFAEVGCEQSRRILRFQGEWCLVAGIVGAAKVRQISDLKFGDLREKAESVCLESCWRGYMIDIEVKVGLEAV